MDSSSIRLAICAIAVAVYSAAGMGNSLYELTNTREGETNYQRYCAECHSLNLTGSAHGSALSGTVFRDKWHNKLNELYETIVATMPPGGTDIPDAINYRDMFAYILKFNNMDDIDMQQLPSINASADAESWVSFSETDTVQGLTQRAMLFKNKPLVNFQNLSKDDINYPDDADWTSWRRTPTGHGYSPLAQITPKNIHRLKLAWSLAMHEGSNQGTPLVTQGIMFLTHPGNIIQALDARTGSLIWEYRHSYPKEARTLGGPTRNIAIYQDKVFMATYDAAIIALDITTGELLWKTIKADYKDGYTHTSGPIIANGVV
ncbi:MAG: PQQ-binding-like beta-propeller repeat protein, partial [Gammaproteobacteria bacterium]